MCVVIGSKVIISNAFYAYYQRDNNFTVMPYKDVEKFKKILYREMSKKYSYIMFTGDDSNCLDIYQHLFIKENEGILCLSNLDEIFIKKVNSIYPEDIQNIIAQSRKVMIG